MTRSETRIGVGRMKQETLGVEYVGGMEDDKPYRWRMHDHHWRYRWF